ncbi:tetratricopeptide repeat protein [Anaeramoeba flamelloides]|uniref:Tetratricopeptide repeat protein n=1 Tax=Anaeramoeba flamelloides TaxID=1746091 RepID=A0ABQ8XCS4_9EUKA|nr:tetratricopeptide repeat protein [Anaeramoeba flamelloides]
MMDEQKKNNSQQYLTKGNNSFEAGDIEQAITYYQKSLLNDPKNGESLFHLAFAFEEQGQFEDALKSNQKCLLVMPQNGEAHNNLAFLLQVRGDLENAEKHLRLALSIVPSYAEANNNMGTVLGLLGNHAEAVKHYRKAIKISPDYREAHHNLGNTLVLLGKDEEVINSYEFAIQSDLTAKASYYELAELYLKRDHKMKAIEVYKRLLKQNPTDAEVPTQIGIILYNLGKYKESKEYFQSAVSIIPNDCNACFYLGKALSQIEKVPLLQKCNQDKNKF